MNKYRIINPNNNIVRDCKSRTTGAMQNANKEANVANKRLKSLEVQAQRSPNSTKKAGNVNTAQSNAQAARNKQVRTKMLNSTVGKAPEATQHVIKTAVNRTQKDE